MSVDWVGLADTGAAQMALGAVLALAGGWVSETRTRRLKRGDEAAALLDRRLDAVEEEAWALLWLVRAHKKPAHEHAQKMLTLQRYVLAAASSMALREGEHRKARYQCGLIMRSLATTVSRGMVEWSETGSPEMASDAIDALLGVIGRWHVDPRSLAGETAEDFLRVQS